MDQHETDKEFIDNIKSVNFLNSRLESEEKKLILTIKVKGESITNIYCEFKILEKERIWLKSFKYEDFKEYKIKMGFEGSWKSFFKTLELAVNKTSGGDMSLKFQNNLSNMNNLSNNKPLPTKKQSVLNKEKEKFNSNLPNLILTIFHPLSEDLKVKSDIVFERFFNNGTEEYRNLNFEVVLELHESKEFNVNKEKEKALEVLKNVNNHNNILIQSTGRGLSVNDNGNIENRATTSKLELKKNYKRKFQSDLINPNIKKRRGKGVKFVEDKYDDESGEQEVK